MRFVPPAVVLSTAILTCTSVVTAQTRSPTSAVPGAFQGGVPVGTATNEPIRIAILDAINRALQHNLGLLNAEQAAGRARGARWVALADLLPNVNGRLAETRQKINLEAFGFPLPPGTP